MASYNKISEELYQVSLFYSLVKAYQQISSTRMLRTRDSVLANREYMARIDQVFANIRQNYADKLLKLSKKRGGVNEPITFLSHNGKKVALFISTNTGLYGDIVNSTYDLFLKAFKSGEFEAAIVGRYGLNMFLADMPKSPYTFFELEDHNISRDKIEAIIRHIVQYDEIHVFYGKYINVITQNPIEEVISSILDMQSDEKETKKNFLFEPSLEDIMKFFETQMFNSVFEQSVYESQLAKYASRLIAMNRAEDNIKDTLRRLNLDKLQVLHETKNKKQINTMQSVYGLL